MHQPTQTPHHWRVLDEKAGILAHEYTFKSSGKSNCFAVRMENREMLVISPPPDADEGLFTDLLAFGDVGALLANNGFHHLGQTAWRTRFPNARAFAAPEAAARIKSKAPNVGAFEPLDALKELLGPSVTLVDPPATRCGETWTCVQTDGGGYVWFASDIIANLPQLPSHVLFRHIFKWTKSAPGFRLFNMAMTFTLKDKKQVLGKMLDDVRAYPPSVIVPAHGDLVSGPDLPQRTETLLASAL